MMYWYPAELSALAASAKTTWRDRRAFSRIKISKIAPIPLVSYRRLLAAHRDSMAPKPGWEALAQRPRAGWEALT